MKIRMALALLSAWASVAVAAGSIAEIPPPAGVGGAEPFLSSSHGSLLLSWMEPAEGKDGMALRFARLQNGTWSAPRTIATRDDFFVNWADFPSIVEDASGVLFVHWLQKSAKGSYTYDVVMTTSKDGGATWRRPFLLNRDGKRNEHGFVTLAPLASGGVGAAWLDGRNMPEGKEAGDMTLRYATVRANGEIGGEVQLDARTCECCTTGMDMSAGKPVIGYRDRSPEEVRDIAVVRKTAKGWSAPRVLHPDGWKIEGCPVNGPQVAASGSRVAIAWFTGAADRPHVYLSFSDDRGATFSQPVLVDDGKPVGRVDVVMLDGETAVVTWSEQTAAGAELRARRIPRTGKSDSAIKVADSSTARAAGFARAASIGRDVYVAWTEQSAAMKRIHVARLRFPVEGR